MGSVALLLIFFAAGYLLRRGVAEARAERLSLWFNRYVIYVALPALVLIYIPRIEPGHSAWIPVLSAWGLFGLSALLVLIVSRAAGWSRSVTGALLFTVPYGNTSFLGVPFTQALFGEAGLPYTLLYDQLGSFLILSTIGIVQLALYTGREFSVLGTLKRMFLFPAFPALLFSLMIIGTRWPAWLGEPLAFLAATLAPAAMLSIGLQLKLRFEEGETQPFLFAMLLKLLITPLLLLGLFFWMDLHTLAAKVSVLEAGMAPMVSSSIMAILAGLERQFVASVLGYGIVLSFVTLPGVYWLIVKLL